MKINELLIKVMMAIFLGPFSVLPVAYAEPQVVTVKVEGLACPFCAYGLEKKLKKT